MRVLLLLGLFLAALNVLSAQKVLQIEKYGNPNSQKIQIGTLLDYRLAGEEYFREGYIEDFRVKDSLIVFGDRYVKVHNIAELRFPRTWGKAVGTSLIIFGAAWSGFALIGFAADKDPSTSYSSRDAVISAVSAGMGYALTRIVRYKHIRMDKRHRLRLLDLRFKVEPWEEN